MRFTNLPLGGNRVITLALNVPGAMAAERLRDLGASVTKIEPPQGDPLKTVTPHWYSRLTEGVTTVTCDLKTAPGVGLLLEKLADTDLLLTSQRPAALERLGLGWERLHARFPKLCQVAIVGFPAPDQNVSGHDLTYLGSNGLLQPPALPLTLYADVAGSEQAALAAVAVLLGRQRAGSAEYVEVAIADAAKRLAAPRDAGLTMGAPLWLAHFRATTSIAPPTVGWPLRRSSRTSIGGCANSLACRARRTSPSLLALPARATPTGRNSPRSTTYPSSR